MAERKLEIQMLLEDKKALSQLKKSMGDLDGVSKRSAMSFMANWKSVAVTLGAVALAAEGFRRFMVQNIEAAQQQENAIQSLNFALKNQGTFTEELSAKYQAMATSFQRTTAFGDEAVLEVQQQLVTFGQVGEAEMQRVTQAVLDLATAKRIDLRAATDLVAKAAVGETGSLSRYGIIIDKNLKSTEKFGAVLSIIEQRMGGAAQDAVKTYAGATTQLSNAWGDLREEFGQYVTESPAVRSLIEDTTSGIIKLTEWLDQNKGSLDSFVDWVRDVGNFGETAYLMTEAMVVSFLIGVERLKATGWKGFKHFLLAGPAGIATGFSDAAGSEDASNPVIDGLTDRLDEIMETIKTKVDEAKENGSSVTDLLAPNPDELDEKLSVSKDRLQETLDWVQLKTDEFKSGFEQGFGVDLIKSSSQFFTHFGKNVGSATQQATSMFSNTTTQIILGQKKAGEGFKELGASLAGVFVKMAIEMAAQQAIALAANAIIGSASAATAGAIAAAWYPAAALVSLATFGANAAPAAAGITTTTALASGIAALSRISGIPGAAKGGNVMSPGSVLVGERGPEILNLPAGAQVVPLDRSPRGGTGINITMNIQNVNANNQDDVRALALMVSQIIADEERVL